MVLTSPSVKQMDVRWATLGQNQLGSLRRDGKKFVEKRRRKKREKERKKRKEGRKENKKKEKKGEREEEAFSFIVSDLGGSRTDPTHFKR